MKNKKNTKLWWYYTVVVFWLTSLSFVFFAFLTFFILRYGQVQAFENLQLFILFLTTIAIFVSTGISYLVIRRIYKPINKLRKSMSEVAKGNLSIQLNDIQHSTEIAELYSDFNSMVKDLNSLEVLREDFISSVSHEFKTPITTIQGYVQLLQNDMIDYEEKKRYLNRILEGTTRLTKLTDNILQISKYESQNTIIQKDIFRLDEQLRQVILFLQPKWEEKLIDLDINLERCYIEGNEEMFYQVWFNILDNAIKYSEVGGKISIILELEDFYTAVSIIDNGIGLKPEELDKIFDKFYQVDNSRYTDGNGLGLTLCKKIIDIHGGKIEVKSQKFEGTSIKTKLPQIISTNNQQKN